MATSNAMRLIAPPLLVMGGSGRPPGPLTLVTPRGTRGAPRYHVRSGGSGRPPGRSNHAVAAEGGEVGLAELEEPPVHLRVVFPEQRRALHLGGRGGHSDRAARNRHPTTGRMVHVDDHPAPPQVLVVQDRKSVV